MFQDTPIYSRLIAEHGDVPAQYVVKPTAYTVT